MKIKIPIFVALSLLPLLWISQTGIPESSGANQEDYKFFKEWGTSKFKFSNPTDVAIDSSGNVIILDTDNDNIQKISSNGTLLAKWGSKGTGVGKFDSPFGLALDSDGNVY